MLKKSLQYLIRCSFLLAFTTVICLSSLLCSCEIQSNDDIFAFLKTNAAYSITVKQNDDMILSCTVTVTFENNTQTSILTFEDSSTLNGAGVSFFCSQTESYFIMDQTPLKDFKSPAVFKDICCLFFPPTDAVSVTSNKSNSACTIEAVTSSQSAVSYTLSSSGDLCEISSNDLTITVNSITKN